MTSTNIIIAKHLFDWMSQLPVIDPKNATPTQDDFGFLLNYQMDMHTSKQIINGVVQRDILNYMIKLKN